MAEKRREMWRKQRGPIEFVAFDEDAINGCEVVEGSIIFHMTIRIATSEIRYGHVTQADIEEVAQQRIMRSMESALESSLTELRAEIDEGRRL